jgi:hypothetical protein
MLAPCLKGMPRLLLPGVKKRGSVLFSLAQAFPVNYTCVQEEPKATRPLEGPDGGEENLQE